MRHSVFSISYVICTFLALTIISTVLVIYCYNSYKFVSNQQTNDTNKLLIALTVACMSSYAWLEIMVTVEIFLDETLCYVRTQMTTAAFCFSKFCLYYLFLYRLHLVFGKSFYAYSVAKLRAFGIFLAMLFCGYLGYGLIVIYGRKTNISDCTWSGPSWFVALFGGTDLIISIVLLILFLRPLMKMSEGRPEKHFLKLAIKYAILTSCAVTSTFVSLLLIAMTGILFHAIRVDDTINCVCLLLMNKWFDDPYHKLCRKCIRCCISRWEKKGVISASLQSAHSNSGNPNIEASKPTQQSSIKEASIKEFSGSGVDITNS